MSINGHTALCALLGDPVSHSLSPLIHNIFFETEGINGVYTAFRVKKEDVKEALEGGRALGIKGFNVTVPLKEAVIPYLSGIDPLAEAIGAVNTLVLNDEGYMGYNTDAAGFMREVKEKGFNIKGEKVIMIGAGGAANAVLNSLYALGAEGVYILNRSVEKAMEKFGSDKRNVILPLDGFNEIPGDKYFCVQCTSAGLHPDTGSAPVYDEDFYKKIDRAVDIIYNPAETEFMKRVRAAGGRAENGLDMLLYQAAESFSLFNKVSVSDVAVKKAGEAIIK